ncbi:hypothetical protein MTR_0236s0020 [Medicago truncatula]|uniref:Uncharacterized protein n=1 Tax=Medicago truncatula TaxID=3880 RepID=A0A072TG22_MEDTR|nr:hypothetical protein MTR_0236s0020 [Medicago truncatula]
MTGGHWLTFYHYLAVSKWSPEFASPNAKFERIVVWAYGSITSLAYLRIDIQYKLEHENFGSS